MTSEQWQRVKELFEAAIECRRTERSAYLTEACRDDDEVRQEVESLLLAHDRDSGFMNEPLGSMLPPDEPILAMGQRFGHYEEISLLGKGGMGQVYVAVDKRLGRKVALKLLPSAVTHDPGYVKRLEQEARAASALNHPNIITIHDIGEIESIHFMATEFVEGETLRDRLSRARLTIAEVLDVAAQVASALQAAHESGIVHRDVKPENIMLRRDGVVKVLDFGLAKLTQANVDSKTTKLAKTQTNASLIMGTIAYMSPEQAHGDEVDLRTDVWSLGVVLYEMIARRAPFSGDTPHDVLIAIRDHEPPPLHQAIPEDLVRIVNKALNKKPGERQQSAGEMALELNNLREELKIEARLGRLRTSYEGAEISTKTAEQVAMRTGDTDLSGDDSSLQLRMSQINSAIKRHKLVAVITAVLLFTSAITYVVITRKYANNVVVTRRSIAVLPFKPADNTHRDEIFEAGMADVLIKRLSSIQGLVLRSLESTRNYREETQDPIAAGKEQQVDYVISTSYQVADGKIHIAANLVNISTGKIEQTYNFEKASGDVLAMQDAVATEITSNLQKQFATGVSQRLTNRGTSNPEAYRLYLHGMYLANKRNLEASSKAIEELEQAVSLDPNYARAWAGLGYAHRTLSLYTRSVSTKETYQKSIAAINKALSLDPNLSEAHSALCENQYLYEWNFSAAELTCKHAIELDPNSGQAHEIYSRYLMGRGRHDEAIAEIETAIDLDPTSRFNQHMFGRALYYARRYPEAVLQLKRVLDMDQTFLAPYPWLISTLALQNNEAEAFEYFQKMLAARKIDERTVQVFKDAFQSSGWRGVLNEWLKNMDRVGGNTFDGAVYNAMLGNKEAAFEYLEQTYQRREIYMTYLRVEPRLDSVRNDPRFIDLLRRVESK